MSWAKSLIKLSTYEVELLQKRLGEITDRRLQAEMKLAVLEAEGLRQAEILRAEGEKQATILAADGRREAAVRDAEARERLAEAEAKATQMVSDAIARGNVQALNYFIAQKYTEAVRELATAQNQRVILFPVEATGLIGSLGGIAELAKETFARREGGKGGAA